MRRVLATDRGGELYAKRKGMIEPIFADTKFNRRCDRFQQESLSGSPGCGSLAHWNLEQCHRYDQMCLLVRSADIAIERPIAARSRTTSA